MGPNHGRYLVFGIGIWPVFLRPCLLKDRGYPQPDKTSTG